MPINWTYLRQRPSADSVRASKAYVPTTEGWFCVVLANQVVWTNGHILDVEVPPYPGLVECRRARTDGLREADALRIKVDSAPMRPLAFVYRHCDGDIDGSGPPHAVVFETAQGGLWACQPQYVAYFLSKHEPAQFVIGIYPDTDPQPVGERIAEVRVAARLVGLVMPLRIYAFALDRIKAALQQNEASAKPPCEHAAA